jgi:hypothetical protein
MFKKILILLIVFGAVSFFEPAFLNRQTIGAIHLLLACIILAFIIFYTIYDTSPKMKATFAVEISLLLFAVFLSMFGAFLFHYQKFSITLFAQRVMYIYFFYFLLHRLKPDPKFIFQIILLIGLLWGVFYLIQWFAYPTKIFGSRMSVERNTIRIAIPGGTFAVVAYYMCIMNFLRSNRFSYLLFAAFLLVLFVLLGTRQLLAPVILMPILMTISSRKINSKLVLSFLGILCLIPVYFIFKDIFDAMVTVTKQQSTSITENIRFQAALFYLVRFPTNGFTFILGNGAYSAHSAYGIMMDGYSKIFGYYLADIGIIGEYILYGIIFVFTELVIIVQLAVRKYPDEMRFIRYVAYTVFLGLFTGSGAFGISEGIALFCMLLYLVDVAAWMKKNPKASLRTGQDSSGFGAVKLPSAEKSPD